MLLSDFFHKNEILKDGVFEDLGYSNHLGKDILTFCDDIYYLKRALSNKMVSAVIIKEDMTKEDMKGRAVLLSDNPRKTFFDLYERLRDDALFHYPFNYHIDKSAKIAKSAIVSDRCFIGKNSVISDNVIIKDNVFIGDNCFIDCGAVLGCEGILYEKDENNNTRFIKHAGIVKIGDGVTLLANSVVVRSVFPNMPTVVSDYSIVGISSTVGHEASVGKNCKILGNCVIAKNVQIGADTIIGSSSVVRENIKIGKNADIKAGSIVVKDVKDGSIVSGNFAINHRINVKEYMKKRNQI